MASRASGRHPFWRVIRGREALLPWLDQLTRLGFWLTEHDVFASDDHVCAVSIMGARRDGVDVQTRVVTSFHYQDGQQTERWLYPDDRAAWDAIFAA